MKPQCFSMLPDQQYSSLTLQIYSLPDLSACFFENGGKHFKSQGAQTSVASTICKGFCAWHPYLEPTHQHKLGLSQTPSNCSTWGFAVLKKQHVFLIQIYSSWVKAETLRNHVNPSKKEFWKIYPLTKKASLLCSSPFANKQYQLLANKREAHIVVVLCFTQYLILNALLSGGECIHLPLPSCGHSIQVLHDVSSVNLRFPSHHASSSVMNQAGPLIYLGREQQSWVEMDDRTPTTTPPKLCGPKVCH